MYWSDHEGGMLNQVMEWASIAQLAALNCTVGSELGS